MDIYVFEEHQQVEKLLRNNFSDLNIISIGAEISASQEKKIFCSCSSVLVVDYDYYRSNSIVWLSLLSEYQDANVILWTKSITIKDTVSLIRSGIKDIVDRKENEEDVLVQSIQKIIAENLKQQEVSFKRIGLFDGNRVVGDSKAIHEVIEKVKRAIELPSITVAVFGESGTGKELIARTIHGNRLSEDAPFVLINLNAIDKEQQEPLFWGDSWENHQGMWHIKPGCIEEANNGTLYIKDVDELTPQMQEEFLQFLQTRKLNRMQHTVKKMNVKIIVSSQFDLIEKVNAGKFNSDLYFHLQGLPIAIPPLKERQHDIILLANSFVKNICFENGIPLKSLSLQAKKRLLDYDYPGNISELKAIMQLAVVMSKNSEIDAVDISFNHHVHPLKSTITEMTLKEHNKQLIQDYLERHHHNVVKVAQILGVGKSTIYNLLKEEKVKLHIDEEHF